MRIYPEPSGSSEWPLDSAEALFQNQEELSLIDRIVRARRAGFAQRLENVQPAAIAEDRRPVDYSRKLANIAGPIVHLEAGEVIGRRDEGAPKESKAAPFRKMPGEGRNIASPGTQRWDPNGEYAHAVPQVLSKGAIAEHLRHFAMRCRHDSYVGCSHFGASNPNKGAVLQNAQKAYLGL